MHNITDYILSKTDRLKVQPEVSPGDHGYSMFNSGGVEVEIAELLYSLVRCWKPEKILETGTHLGVSALYMALACEKNNKGGVVTCEIGADVQAKAKALWQDVGMSHRINSLLRPSLSLQVSDEIDFLFLDSEPQLRFDEFVKFFPNVKPGGLIIIHDLNNNLGHHGITHHGVFDWPYGNWREKLSSYVKNHEVQLIFPPNPRGMSVFQKTIPTDENIALLRGN